MNCPYCDEVINAMAKFCPKCGLPLKDDSTVMGTYVSDSDGPNWGILGLGAGAILIIALAIGFFSRGTTPTESVRREPVGQFGNPGGSQGFRNSAPLYNTTPNPRYAGSTVPSMSTARPRWAYTPPATPAPAPAMAMAPQGPEAPRHFNLMAPVINRRPPVVEIARSTGPELPVMSPEEASLLSQMYGNIGTDSDTAGYDVSPGTALNNQINRVEADGVWIYDPVQERWALRPDAKRRRGARRQQNDASMAPSDAPSGLLDLVPNPQ